MVVTPPRFFRTQKAFRSWLEKNHASKPEGIVVGFHKVGTGKGGLTYGQALDEALCFGWIDGVRRGGEDSWSIRFTPRRKGSIWSRVNIAHVERLKKAGLMRAEGLAEYARRSDKRTGVYGHENNRVPLDAAREKTFRQNKKAWAFWERQPPGYRRLWSWWVMSAKQEPTRERRLEAVIAASADGEKLDPMASPYKRKQAKA
jgi:uncharacterized protein YdeI (YjbR/CyaY-like superfamily)